MTEQDKHNTPRAKLSPPAEHEAEPALDVRLPAFGDAEAWSRVRLGLLLQPIANSIAAISIAYAFIFDHCFQAVGGDGHLHVSLLLMSSETIAFTVLVLFSWWLMFVAGILCRQVPRIRTGRGKMTLSLSCHLAWFVLLGTKAYLEYFHHMPFEWNPWPMTPAWQMTLHASLSIGIFAAAVSAMTASTRYLCDLFRTFGMERAVPGAWISLIFTLTTLGLLFLPTQGEGLVNVFFVSLFVFAVLMRSIMLLNLRRAILLGNHEEDTPPPPISRP